MRRDQFLSRLGSLGASGWIAGTGLLAAASTRFSDPLLPETMREMIDDRQPKPDENREPDMANLWPVVERLADRVHYPLSHRNRPHLPLEEHRREGRARVFDALGVRPTPHPLRVERVEQQEFPEFVREKVLFESAPGFKVPAWIHIPKGLRKPAPGIVDLHSHGGMFLYGKEKVIDFEENDETMQRYHVTNYEGRPTTTELVRRGYVVVTTDAFLFGERRVMLKEDLDRYGWDRSAYSPEVVRELNLRCRAKANTFVKSMNWLGMSWPGIVTRDDMRTVDLISSLPEVDPRRIGCLGVSFGGWRTLLLAGMDDRIRAACVTGFMTRVGPMLRNHVDTHSWVHFIPGVHRDLDLPDIVGLRAPLPLLVQQCRRDGLYPTQGMEEAVEDLERIYRLANADKNFEGRFYDERHIFNRQMQEEAFDWMDRQLSS
ncbi:MAG: alpha/beta hydrolase family protein [Bacteroidota bacterium]